MLEAGVQSFDVRSNEKNIYNLICNDGSGRRMMGGLGFDGSRIGDTRSVGEGGAGDLRGSCLEGTRFPSCSSRMISGHLSMMIMSMHAYLRKPFTMT